MKRPVNLIVNGPWPYWVGAIVLAFLNVLVFIVNKTPWGVTRNLEAWAEWLGLKLGLPVTNFYTLSDLLSAYGTYTNLGVIFGAFLATLAASQARFRPIRSKKFFYSALIGGFLMGYGARIASGCNVGGMLNGIASGSLTGWVFAIFILLGTWIGSKILLKYLI
ncbi:MAG: YeeE/YedE thiosulfate transporter family protein [Desulfitobacterium hafniense]|nr:YeeE/YedE thiosulfate transporter family protein [Desulfitobacterium hafniense]